MLRYLCVLFVLLAGECYGELYRWSQPSTHHGSVVRVQCPDGAAGSGVYVQLEGLRCVLTASHVVSTSTATVTFPSGTRSSGETTSDRFGHDIAAILIDEVNEPAARVAAKFRGGEIEICGYGGPGPKLFRHFLCNHTDTGERIITANGKVTQGDSGGPWFIGGEVVGIQSTGANPLGGYSGFDIFTLCHSARTDHLGSFCQRLLQRFRGRPSQQPGSS